jgi:hypothetical protein
MIETVGQTMNASSSGRDTKDRLDAAARMLPRRKFFSDMPDKGLFGLVALVGFGGIMLLKTYTQSTRFPAA